MILNRLKDILIANINDQLESNPLFQDKFKKTLEDLEKEFDFDFSRFKSERSHYEEAFEESSYSGGSYEYQDSNNYQYTNKQQDTTKQKEKAYYEALELKEGASFAEIKKAYRKQMKIYHPDLYHNDPEKYKVAKEVSLKLNEAYTYFEKKYK